jgi:hypothetical protein
MTRTSEFVFERKYPNSPNLHDATSLSLDPHDWEWTVSMRPKDDLSPAAKIKMGEIRWHPTMNQHCYYPTVPHAFFTANALDALAEALEDLNREN